MEGPLPWVVFAFAALAVAVAGWQLARQGDRISEQSGLGGLWIGAVLLASATSLPEIVTDVTAAAIDQPDLAAGDLFGSSMANMAVLALVDLIHRRTRVLQKVSQGHTLVAMLAIILTALAAAFIVADNRLELGHIGIETVLLGAVYLAGTRIVFVQEYMNAMARMAESLLGEEAQEKSDRRPRINVPQTGTLLRFGAAAVVILATAPLLALSGESISEQTGLEASFVGVLFLAMTTSLPELASSFTAVRMGAYDLAVGNLFGSNCFNMFAFVFVDLAFTEGPIFSAVSEAQVVAALAAIVLMATAMMGVIYRAEKRYFFVEPDAAAVLVGYVLALFLVYDATG